MSLYTNGPFTDLCRGPHAPSTAGIGAFRLQSVAGAYWRGDSSRTMLTRIYGTAFFSKSELAAHLERLEQARARDHRKLGRELDLFMFSELSPGSPIFKPAGMAVWNALTELWTFSCRHWVNHFRQHNFEVILAEGMGLFYTGRMIFGQRWSLQSRARAASVLGSACILYKVTPRLPRRDA